MSRLTNIIDEWREEVCRACSYSGAVQVTIASREELLALVQRAYRQGYNDRASSSAHAYQMYGIREHDHGEGENP